MSLKTTATEGKELIVGAILQVAGSHYYQVVKGVIGTEQPSGMFYTNGVMELIPGLSSSIQQSIPIFGENSYQVVEDVESVDQLIQVVGTPPRVPSGISQGQVDSESAISRAEKETTGTQGNSELGTGQLGGATGTEGTGTEGATGEGEGKPTEEGTTGTDSEAAALAAAKASASEGSTMDKLAAAQSKLENK